MSYSSGFVDDRNLIVGYVLLDGQIHVWHVGQEVDYAGTCRGNLSFRIQNADQEAERGGSQQYQTSQAPLIIQNGNSWVKRSDKAHQIKLLKVHK